MNLISLYFNWIHSSIRNQLRNKHFFHQSDVYSFIWNRVI